MAKDRIIKILGVPFNGDGTTPAEENPAAALRLAGITDFRSLLNLKVEDLGNIEIPAFSGIRDPGTSVLNLNAWKKISRRTSERLQFILDDGEFLIVLGGDCSILLGVFGAFALADMSVGLMMLDGHTDYREPTSSSSGEPADLETAVLTGTGPKQLTNMFGKAPLINPHDIVVCGYREPDMIENSIIRHFSAEELKQIGPDRLAQQELEHLSHPKDLWFHLDVDVLDPEIMPVCFPEPRGLDHDETFLFLENCMSSGRFIGISIACYHPKLDPDLSAASKLAEIVKPAILMGIS
jgi:arginase